MNNSREKKLKKKIGDNTKKIIGTLIIALMILIVSIISDMFPEQVNNYIESDLNIPVNETNAITVSTLESTVVTSDSELKIYYFDVGQADSELIIADDKVMLIDAGNAEDGSNLAKYIKALGVKKIDYLVGTHAHEDHIGGMEQIVKSFDIGMIYMPDVSTTTRTYENLLEAISKKGLGVSSVEIGDTIPVGSGVCTVMNVRNDEQDDLNDTSICLHFVYGENKFLFMGDASENMEKEIEWPEVDVLKVGHHGSSTSSSEDFLSQTKPKVAIISCGANNTYGHPNEDALKRLENIGAEIYRTDKDGTILLTSNGSTYNIQTIKTNIDGNESTSNKTENTVEDEENKAA